jgi:hypothetical protein
VRRVRRCPGWLWRWIDRRSRIPWWARLLWPKAHFCPEMDELLVIDNTTDCFCGRYKEENRKYWDDFARALNARRLADFDADPPF